MSEGGGDTSFAAIRAAFEACVELEPAARAAWLGREAPAVAAQVRELLDIADREAAAEHDHGPMDLLDAAGRGLVLVDRPRRVVTRLFRIAADRRADFESAVARVVAATPALVPSGWVATLAGGVAAGDVAWTASDCVAGPVRVLPELWPELGGVERRRWKARCLDALEAAIAAGITAPWPRPRQLLLNAEGALRLADPGLSRRFALDPRGGGALDAAAAIRALCSAVAGRSDWVDSGRVDIADDAAVLRQLRATW